MPSDTPSARALVRYRVTTPQAPAKAEPVLADAMHAPTFTPDRPPLGTPSGGDVSEEFELDPPTNSVAEVEKRWREANADTDRVWVDADLLQPDAEEEAASEPPAEPPKDSQIVKERAAGRSELPSTVTEDEEAGPKGKIKSVSGGKGTAESEKEDLNALTVPELQDRARAAGVEAPTTLHKDELVKAVRKAEKKGT